MSERDPGVEQRRAPGVVEVQTDVRPGATEHLADAAWRRHPRRVGERHRVDTCSPCLFDEGGDVVGSDLLPVERRAEASAARPRGLSQPMGEYLTERS